MLESLEFENGKITLVYNKKEYVFKTDMTREEFMSYLDIEKQEIQPGSWPSRIWYAVKDASRLLEKLCVS